MTALRCRPGDLAVVTGPCKTPGLRGRFVIVEQLVCHSEIVDGARAMTYGVPTWVCRAASSGGTLPRAMTNFATGTVVYVQGPRRIIADELLSPIRPDAGEDEMLRLAGRPRVEEPA